MQNQHMKFEIWDVNKPFETDWKVMGSKREQKQSEVASCLERQDLINRNSYPELLKYGQTKEVIWLDFVILFCLRVSWFHYH